MKQLLSFITAVLFCFLSAAPGLAEIPRGSLAVSPGDPELAVRQKTDYNNAYRILFSLLASSAAYEPENSTEAGYLAGYGWTFAPHRITDGKTTVHFITAKGTMADGRPLYVISFRGSADKKDWATDFVTGQVVYGGKNLEESEQAAGIIRGERGWTDTKSGNENPGREVRKNRGDGQAPPTDTGASDADTDEDVEDMKTGKGKREGQVLPRVHKGFNTYADLALRMLLDAASHEFLDRYRQEKDACLLLTGHSLGGAVATLVGQRLIDFGFDPDRLQVITFGAPAIANKTFKQMYGDRLNLIRVTNREDPVPLTLQAVLRNYRQFGEEIRFRIPRTMSNMNHFLNLYLDFGLRYYYDALDRAVKNGFLEEWPETRRADREGPLVLIHVKYEDVAAVRETMAILERFMLNEYKALLPNYVVARPGADPYEAMRESGADYLLQLEFKAEASRENNNWFLTLEQILSDKEGSLLTVGSTVKRTSPLAGNILAAMEAVGTRKAELIKHMPRLAGKAE